MMKYGLMVSRIEGSNVSCQLGNIQFNRIETVYSMVQQNRIVKLINIYAEDDQVPVASFWVRNAIKKPNGNYEIIMDS